MDTPPPELAPSAHARTAAKRIATRAALALWFAAMLAIGVSLLVRHSVALPRPTADAELARSMSALRSPLDVDRWMVVHVLYGECRCSQRIAEHLLSSPRPVDVVEYVLLVGADAALEARLTVRGFRTTVVASSELAERYHVVAAPLLVVIAPSGGIRYAGGYTTRKQGPDPQDLSLVATARDERWTDALPVFGCAVSEKLQRELNPLGLP